MRLAGKGTSGQSASAGSPAPCCARHAHISRTVNLGLVGGVVQERCRIAASRTQQARVSTALVGPPPSRLAQPGTPFSRAAGSPEKLSLDWRDAGYSDSRLSRHCCVDRTPLAPVPAENDRDAPAFPGIPVPLVRPPLASCRKRAKAPVIAHRGLRVMGRDSISRIPVKISAGIGLLSHARVRSIIGDGGLNFRVRNGIGCTPSSMDTSTNFWSPSGKAGYCAPPHRPGPKDVIKQGGKEV